MSQGGTIKSSGGGGGGTVTFAGDLGSSFNVSSVTIRANTASLNCGKSVNITSNGTNTLTLNVTDVNDNTLIGDHAGNASMSGAENVGLGRYTLNQNTTGYGNVTVGNLAAYTNATGFGNVCVGDNAFRNATDGNSNICIGANAGNQYVSTESSNICISNQGTLGESGVINIGTSGTHTVFKAAGIYNVAESGTSKPVMANSNGQLGTGNGAYAGLMIVKTVDVDFTTTGTTLLWTAPADFVVTGAGTYGTNIVGTVGSPYGTVGFNGPSYDNVLDTFAGPFFAPQTGYTTSPYANQVNYSSTITSGSDLYINVITADTSATTNTQKIIFQGYYL